MATVKQCDKCGAIIEDVSYGPLEIDSELATLTIDRKSDIGDVCVVCLRKSYYAAARKAFESLQTKRAKKSTQKGATAA